MPPGPGILKLVPYDRSYLDLSWSWLNDPETKALTMTPDFTREDQERHFASLPGREDYLIWGVELAGHGPVGAAGIKRIETPRAEYWGYIGEKSLWGLGLGRSMVAAVEAKAAAIGLTELYLRVSEANERGIRLYAKLGYDRAASEEGVITMAKGIAHVP